MNIQHSADDTIQIVAPSTLTSGTPIRIAPGLYGVPVADAASGAVAALATRGNFRLPKAAGGVAFSLGARVYWSQSGGVCTATVTDDLIGVCTAAAAIGDAEVRTLIAGGVAAPTAQKVGTVTIAGGAQTGTASVGAGLNGMPVQATIQAAAGAIAGSPAVLKAVVAGGTLTVTLIDAASGAGINAGSALTVSYLIHGAV